MAGVSVDRKNVYVPSGFHGAMEVFLGMRDVVPILHGPGGCTNYVWTNIMRADSVAMHACSTVLDDQLISSGGSVERLKAVVRMVEERYAPALIPIVSTHIGDTIGEDIESVVRRMGKDHVVFVNSKSLQEDDDTCKGAVLRSLVERFAAPQERVPRSVNVIGPGPYSFNWRSDLAELKELLGKLGVRVNSVFPLDCSTEDVCRLPSAALNLVMYSHGLQAARYLRERFGVEYVEAFPVGFQATIRFVEALERHLAFDAREVVTREMERHFVPFSDVVTSAWHDSMSNEMQTFAVVARATQALEITEFLVKEVGMTPLLIAAVDEVSREDLEAQLKARGVAPRVVMGGAKSVEVEKWLRRMVPAVILGSDYEEKVADELKVSAFIPVSHPSMHTFSVGVTPFWGFRGGCYLVQEILKKGTRLLKSIRAISISTRAAPLELASLVFAKDWAPDALDRCEYVLGMIPRFLGNRVEISQRFVAACELSAPTHERVALQHVESAFDAVGSHFAR